MSTIIISPLPILLFYSAVLVAHNGYNSDFVVLFVELKRHGVDISCFEENDVYFSDTLEHLQKVRPLSISTIN